MTNGEYREQFDKLVDDLAYRLWERQRALCTLADIETKIPLNESARAALRVWAPKLRTNSPKGTVRRVAIIVAEIHLGDEPDEPEEAQ